jgi:hypothetical protein
MPSRKDRCEGQFLAGDLRRLHGHQRRLDLDHLERQIAGDFIAQKHADLVQKLPKSLGGAVAVAHQRELVLYEGVTDEINGTC